MQNQELSVWVAAWVRSLPPQHRATAAQPRLEPGPPCIENCLPRLFANGEVEKTTLDKMKQEAQSSQHTEEGDESSERPMHDVTLAVSDRALVWERARGPGSELRP
jgi:hypothetical protein